VTATGFARLGTCRTWLCLLLGSTTAILWAFPALLHHCFQFCINFIVVVFVVVGKFNLCIDNLIVNMFCVQICDLQPDIISISFRPIPAAHLVDKLVLCWRMAFFIMSPNMEVLYEPPFGQERHMQFCKDFCYGDDDPLLWLQPYISMECHFPAIPLCPGSGDPMAVMWWQLTREEFNPSTRGIMTGVAVIHPTKLAQMGWAITSLPSHATAYMNDEFPDKS
jgi:hypothetical protein